jgi:hypothetical protein
MQVIVARIHSGLDMPGISDGSERLFFLTPGESAGRQFGRPQISLCHSHRHDSSRRFISPSTIGLPLLPITHRQECEELRQNAI